MKVHVVHLLLDFFMHSADYKLQLADSRHLMLHLKGAFCTAEAHI